MNIGAPGFSGSSNRATKKTRHPCGCAFQGMSVVGWIDVSGARPIRAQGGRHSGRETRKHLPCPA